MVVVAAAALVGGLTGPVLMPQAASAASSASVQSAAAGAVPTETRVVQTSTKTGKLTRREKRDVVRAKVKKGTLTTSVRFTGKSQHYVVIVRQKGSSATRIKGNKTIVLNQEVSAGQVKILLKRASGPRRKAKWKVQQAVVAPTPAPVTPAPVTPAPTPTVSQTPAPVTSAPQTPAESPAPTPTAPPVVVPDPEAPVITPAEFGAIGDGVADDTAAVQNAFDSLETGDTLTIPAGKTYRHTAVLKLSTPGVTITGSGTLLATAEATSAVHLAADNITLDGVTLTMGSTTKRWVAFEQMKLRIGRYDGIVVQNVTVDGSAAAGIYVGGASNFTLSDVLVRNTNADGIHMTTGAHDGVVRNARVVNPGDDGVAVVSYRNDGELVRNITVESPRVEGQRWGRGFSVVGGDSITFNNVYARDTAGAGIYLAAESEFNTYGVSNILIDGGTLLRANQQADTDAADRPSPDKGRVVHGAIMVYNSQPDQRISDVTVQNVTITDTHPQGYDHVRAVSYSGQVQERLEFRGIHISGGSDYLFKPIGVPAEAYRTIGWTHEGAGVPNHIGW
ncbi:MAG: right-handed parallel beta-helix repeat-containing protein [Actinobacteria bacterium]|nr:right-handed parallel beta-helix repeat-containing protein [Actinomycetota bacterium]